MDVRSRKENDMSRRAYLFLDENKNDFTSINAVTATIAILQTELQKLAELGTEKISATFGAKDSTIYKSDLRIALKKAMQDIADMWIPMAKNYENALNKFKMPRGGDHLLIATAGSFIEDATPLHEAFTNRGMATTFIDDLIAKRDAFQRSFIEASNAQIERIGINAQFPITIKKCVAAVRDVDPIVKMIYRDNPGKLAEWLSASHIERAAKRKKPETQIEEPQELDLHIN